MRTFLVFVKDLIVGLVQAIVSSPLAMKIIVGIIVVWISGLIIAPEQTQAVNPFIGRWKERVTTLEHSLGTARTITLRTEKMLEESLEVFLEKETTLRAAVDRLRSRPARVVSVSRGEGRVDHEGGGSTTTSGQYKDPWITARITERPAGYGQGPFDLRYSFTFSVHDVHVTLQEEDGAQVDVFDVTLRSTSEPGKVMKIGRYRKERRAVHVLIEPDNVGITDHRRLRWWDPAISIDGVLLGPDGLEAGLAISLMSWGTGPRQENEIILRLPEFGISSDVERSSHAFVGVRINIGHVLPVLTDLYVAPKYAINAKGTTRFMIGIGTRL